MLKMSVEDCVKVELKEGAKAANVGVTNVQYQTNNFTMSQDIRKRKMRHFTVPSDLLEDDFVGHQELLDNISTGVKVNQKVAIYGLGGIGKSRAAAEVARRLQSDVFDCVFWLDATNSTTFMADMQDIAQELDLSPRQDPRSIANAVKTWMEDVDNGSWLMVLDGASPEAVSSNVGSDIDSRERNVVRRLPQRSNKPLRTILITTCELVIAQQWCGTHAIFEVPQLETQAAIELLQHTSEANPSERDYVARLAEELGRIPSAIQSAGKVIRSRREAGSNVFTYLKELRHHKDQVDLLGEQGLSRRTPYSAVKSVTATWLIAIEAVRMQSKDAEDLLCFIACLDGTRLSTGLFRRAFRWKEEKLKTEESVLLNYRLISPSASPSDDERSGVFNMPRLVRRTVRKWMWERAQQTDATDLLSKWHLKALEILLEEHNEMQIRPGESSIGLQRRRRALLPHIELFRKYVRRGPQILPLQEEHIRAIVVFAGLFATEGAYTNAEHILFFVKTCNVQNVFWRNTVRIRLAACLRDQSLIEEGEKRSKLLKKAMDMVRKIKDTQDEVDQIDLWDTLAILHTERGKFLEAAHYQRKVCRKLDSELGVDDLRTLDARLDLSIIYWREGKHQAALEEQQCIEHLLTHQQPSSDPDHELRLLRVKAAIVKSYYSVGRMQEAKQLAEKVVMGRSRLLGEFDMRTIGSQKDLVECLRALKQKDEALEGLQSIQQKLQQKFGVGHEEVQNCITRVDSIRREFAVG